MKGIVIFLIVFTTNRIVKTQQSLEENIYVKKTTVQKFNVTSIPQNQTAHNQPPVSVELVNGAENVRRSYLHAIEEDLLHQNWEEEEQPCLRQLVKIIKNVQNSTVWATWIWDSIQLPVGQLFGSRNHLGNYDQCMHFPWEDHPELRPQYCLAEFSLSHLDPEVTEVDIHESVEKYIQVKTKHGLRYNDLTWGICTPAVCKSESISKFADAMFRSTHLGQMHIQYNISVNPAHCHVAGEFRTISTYELIFIIVTIFLIIITIVCTCYVDFKGMDVKSTSGLDFANAFNIKSNAEWLMKEGEKSLKSLLGIRVILSCAVVSCHLWLLKNAIGVGNAKEIDMVVPEHAEAKNGRCRPFINVINLAVACTEEIVSAVSDLGVITLQLDGSTKCSMFTVDVIVDMFFMMSGLLFTKSIMEKNVKTFNPFTIIVKRYIRLVCSVLVIMLMLSIVLLHGDPGPLVKKFLQHEADVCNTNWWKLVLMFGNYGDTEKMCYPVLWSVPCDFHFFVIGILIYWIYNKSKSAGIKAYIICAVASIIIPVIHGYINKSKAVVSFDFRVSDNYRKNLIADPMYVRTHLRAGPYFVGMAAGYLMVLFRPEKYRNFLSKKTSTLAFIVFLSLLASLITLSGIYHVREYGPLEGALFSVMRRNVFAVLIGVLIFICEYGSLPYVKSALSWSGLSPFSKLSYGVYLTHLMFVFRFAARTRVPLRSDPLDDIFATVGMIALTMTLSFFLWLFWEAPTIKLLDMISKRSSDKIQQSGNLEPNGKSSAKLFTALEQYDEYNDMKEEKKIN